MPKQKYNLKFQEFDIVGILKIQKTTKFELKNFLGSMILRNR